MGMDLQGSGSGLTEVNHKYAVFYIYSDINVSLYSIDSRNAFMVLRFYSFISFIGVLYLQTLVVTHMF
jgi:hypothetical protein